MAKVLYYKGKQSCYGQRFVLQKETKMLWPMYCITNVDKVLYYKSKQRYMTKVLYYKCKQRCITKVL